MTSSGLANMPFPGLLTYSCSKALINNFGQALHYEVKEKIDVMVWQAGHTDTKMIAGMDKSCFELPTKKAVEGSLC